MGKRYWERLEPKLILVCGFPIVIMKAPMCPELADLRPEPADLSPEPVEGHTDGLRQAQPAYLRSEPADLSPEPFDKLRTAPVEGRELLADHTTLRVGGPARRMITVETEVELVEAVTDLDVSGE